MRSIALAVSRFFGSKNRSTPSREPLIAAEPLESRVLLQGVPDLTVQISTSVARSVSFVEADGTHASVSIAGPGAATLNFDGTGLVSNLIGKTIKITGAAPSLDSITTTGASVATRLTFNGHGGDNLVALDDLTTDSSFGKIGGARLALTGSVTVAGSLRVLTLGPVTNSTISIGGSASGPSGAVVLGDVSGSSLTSTQPLRNVAARSFSASGTITAPSLGAMNVRSDSSENIAIASAARTIAIHGNLAGTITAASIRSISGAGDAATISVSGNLHAATFRQDVSGPIAANSADALTSRGNWTAPVAITNRLGALKVSGILNAAISSGTAGAITVRQSMQNSTLTLTKPFASGLISLKLLNVKQAISGSSITTSAAIGSVVAGSMTNSVVYAGSSLSSGLPTSAADFSAQTSIAKVTVKSTFNNSDIAAYRLGAISLGGIVTSNGATPFGLGADRVATLAGSTVGNEHFKLHQLHDPAALAQLIATSGLTLGDFTVALV